MSLLLPGLKKVMSLCNEFASNHSVEEVRIGPFTDDSSEFKFPYFTLDFEYMFTEQINSLQLSKETQYAAYYIDDVKNYEDTIKRLEDFTKRIINYRVVDIQSINAEVGARRFVKGWIITFT